MQKLLRVLWAIILVLSVAWMAVGLAAAAELVPEDSIITDFTHRVQTVASDLNADQITGNSLPATFVLSGLPVFIIAGFFSWRNSARIGSNRRQSAKRKEQSDSAIPQPFPDAGPPSESQDARALRRQTLGISFLAFVAVFVLWHNRDLEMLVYPLRLFVTFVHEAGHSLAALITGGEVQGFTVYANGSGVATTAGGNRALILPAGYLGAALFGSLLYLLSNRTPRMLPGVAIALGAFLIGLTAIYARPADNGFPIAIFIGVGFGLVILLLGAKAPRVVNQFVLSTLAVMTALQAVLDLWLLVGNAGAGIGNLKNDAAAFAQQITPLLPASVVAVIWAVIAVALLGTAIYIGTIKPLRHEISEVVSGES